MWRSFPNRDAAWLDSQPLPIIGALFGHDMVDPSDEDVQAAHDLIAERGRKAKAWVEQHRPEQVKR